MKRTSKKILVAALLAAQVTAFLPQAANAETVTDVAAGFSAAPRIDFRIIIPGFLRFRVGTNSGVVDQITFDLSGAPADVGNAVAQAGTGGDAGTSVANVSVQANDGQVTITPSNNGAGAGLGTGTGSDGFINYSEITTTSSDATNLPAPTLSNVGGTNSLPVLNAGKVTNRSGTWTYGYANSTIPSAGTYGTSLNGGRVTYTAVTP